MMRMYLRMYMRMRVRMYMRRLFVYRMATVALSLYE